MTREQKVKFIELIQEYVRENQDYVEKYGYTIPKWTFGNLLSYAIFGKYIESYIGHSKKTHTAQYGRNLSPKEWESLNDEYKNLVLNTNAFTLTKSKMSVRISDEILWYNNILY